MRLIENKNTLIKDVIPKISRNGKWSMRAIQFNLWHNQNIWVNGLLGSNNLIGNIHDEIDR